MNVLEYILCHGKAIKWAGKIHVALPFLSLESFALALRVNPVELRHSLKSLRAEGVLDYSDEMNMVINEAKLKSYKEEGGRISREALERIVRMLSEQSKESAFSFLESHRKWCQVNGLSPHA